ncbi:helix-turn-helix transcriptional regulator [Pseudoalteromonas sp. XMcav11-Q]|uniref:helix-turn-helix domain-containing protein n=1 Tax=Pseudoalteromonas sp. XMcav11-Q TaxID=3136665 RepID=UPI0032C4A9CF
MKTNDESPFPKRLKEARKRKGLSQKQLGILAGMDEFSASARMNQYEKGVHAPDFKTVKALAKVLDVPTAFLFCEEDKLAEQILALKSKHDHCS